MEIRRFFVLLLAFAVTISICQSQSYFQFRENNYDAYEGSERVRVEVERTGDRSRSGSVRVRTLESSAASGGDYVALNAVIDFDPDVKSRTVDITIINDNRDELEETFAVRLDDPTNGEIGNPSETVVSINDGDAPSEGLAQEVLIAIIVACVAAVLILLVCCLLIYCLRFRGSGVREDVVYVKRPAPEREPEPYPAPYPEPYPEPYPLPRPSTPPFHRRPYTPTSVVRPRTPPPPVHHAPAAAPNTQVMVINEPSPPIIEPPPPKPTQVIVIRPQTPEIIRHRPQATGPTEVIVSRPRPRSASPVLEPVRIIDAPDGNGRRSPSPVTVVKRIHKPVPIHLDHPGHRRCDDRRDRYDDHHHHDHDHNDDRRNDRFDDRFNRRFDRDRFGSRDGLLNSGPGIFGPSSFSAFGTPFSNSAFGGAGFPTIPRSGFRPSSSFGPMPPLGGNNLFGPQPPLYGPPGGFGGPF